MPHQWAHGSFYLNELMTRDPERDKKFSREARGRSFEGMPMPNGTYWVAKVGDRPVGGLCPLSPQYARSPNPGCPISQSTMSMRE